MCQNNKIIPSTRNNAKTSEFLENGKKELLKVILVKIYLVNHLIIIGTVRKEAF